MPIAIRFCSKESQGAAKGSTKAFCCSFRMHEFKSWGRRFINDCSSLNFYEFLALCERKPGDALTTVSVGCFMPCLFQTYSYGCFKEGTKLRCYWQLGLCTAVAWFEDVFHRDVSQDGRKHLVTNEHAMYISCNYWRCFLVFFLEFACENFRLTWPTLGVQIESAVLFWLVLLLKLLSGSSSTFPAAGPDIRCTGVAFPCPASTSITSSQVPHSATLRQRIAWQHPLCLQGGCEGRWLSWRSLRMTNLRGKSGRSRWEIARMAWAKIFKRGYNFLPRDKVRVLRQDGGLNVDQVLDTLLLVRKRQNFSQHRCMKKRNETASGNDVITPKKHQEKTPRNTGHTNLIETRAWKRCI